MKIAAIRSLFSAVDKKGYKVGARAFNNMDHDELYETAANVAKQSNRQFARMVKAGYNSPAVRGYINAIHPDITSLQGYTEEEILQLGKVQVKKGMTEETLKNQATISLKFMEAKTHTQKGTKAAESAALETLLKSEDALGDPKQSIDMTDMDRDTRRAFWEAIQEMKDKYNDMQDDWSAGSPIILAEIVTHLKDANATNVRDKIEELLKKKGYTANDDIGDGVTNANRLFNAETDEEIDTELLKL